MMDHLPHLQELLRQLAQVPYLASKNLYRVSHHFLSMDERRFAQFLEILQKAYANTKKCERCYALKEREGLCPWCHGARDQRVICVVETWHDLCAVEKSGSFTGVYHVLGGAICPLDGMGPEDLTIEQLRLRCQTGVDELILALNQTPEGEATAAFTARRLEGVPGIKITCLSRGVPVGSSLESMDRLTIFKALSERRLF